MRCLWTSLHLLLQQLSRSRRPNQLSVEYETTTILSKILINNKKNNRCRRERRCSTRSRGWTARSPSTVASWRLFKPSGSRFWMRNFCLVFLFFIFLLLLKEMFSFTVPGPRVPPTLTPSSMVRAPSLKTICSVSPRRTWSRPPRCPRPSCELVTFPRV